MSDSSQHSRSSTERRKQAGCPVCAAQTKAVFDDLVGWQDRLAHSEPARALFLASRGFCSFHMWLLQQIGDPLSLSRSLAPLVEAWADDLDRLADEPSTGEAAAVTTSLPRRAGCPVCRVERDTEAGQLQRLAALAETAEGRVEIARAPALCLRHLLALLRCGGSQDTVRFVLREHSERLRDVAAHLHGYAAKRDVANREPVSEDEQDGWRRALALLAGARAVRDAEPE